MDLPGEMPRFHRSPRLLIVDDIAFVRDLVAEVFARAGYEVDTAATASEALALARLVRWDGLVLDLDMPGMSGVQLYPEMIRLNLGRRLPVIFFTGAPHPALQTSLAGVAWASFIMKPCPAPELVAIMGRCLSAASSASVAPA